MKNAAILSLLVLTGCVTSDLPTSPMSGGLVLIQGRVVDFVTRGGVANAPVLFGGYVSRTDAYGFYRLSIPSGDYAVTADGENLGTLRVVDPELRGDVFVHGANCTAAYGLIVNRWSRQRIPRARVSLVGYDAQSDTTGWYFLDLGCGRSYGIGTTFMSVTATGYVDQSAWGGRRESLRGLRRLDVELNPK